jgi:hypothetical protein
MTTRLSYACSSFIDPAQIINSPVTLAETIFFESKEERDKVRKRENRREKASTDDE